MEANETPRALGRRWGLHDLAAGRRYSKVNGTYPSNPFHVSDPRCAEYNEGYEEVDDQEPFSNGPDTSF